jgi:hypothetical protein
VLNNVDGKVLAMADRKPAVKSAVAADAIRNCPGGGSLANDSQGVDSTHAIWSGCDAEMIEVWPGVSISYGRNIIYELP